MGHTQLPHYHNGSKSRREGLVDRDSPLLSLSKVIEFLPMAAYAVRAPDGVIVWFKAAAAKLWGREPVIGDTDERFCGAHSLYHVDGRHMAHCDTPVGLALKTGVSVHNEAVVIERPDGSRVQVSVHIDPVRDDSGTIIGVVNFFRDNSEQRRAEQGLVVLQQFERLRELTIRLQQSQDEERRRISRELHDSAGQLIAALNMQLDGMSRHIGDNPPLVKAVQEQEELLRQLGKEIRTISYLLHPPLLEETGLVEAIRWYTDGLTKRSGLNIELKLSENFNRLPNDMELALFRMVQECLTNVHRHSGSKTASIRLSGNADSVVLEIKDQGNGIPAEKLAQIREQHAGVGTTGMWERVRHLRGVMDIQSDSGGTTISISLPTPASEVSRARPAVGNGRAEAEAAASC
jgi:two-component system, NarL family, sensor kinase